MGLGNNERIEYLCWSINRMSNHHTSLEEYTIDSRVVLLRDKLDLLWHKFLGMQANNSHWLVGSDADNVIDYSSSSPWAIAVKEHCRAAIKKDADDDSINPFNPFESTLSIEGIVYSVDSLCGIVFSVYRETEHMIYALRRYDDELLKSLEGLSKLISDIQGICFRFFDDDEDFARAYVLHKICVILYGGDEQFVYDDKKNDEVTKWLFSNGNHHKLVRSDISQGGKELAELAELHIKLTKKHSKIDRIFAIISLMGYSFDEYTRDKLYECISKNRSLTKHKKAINKLYKKSVALKAERTEYNTGEDNSLDVYGYLG